MHGLDRRPIYTLLGLLSAGTLFNCNCETEEFLPSVTYDPYPFVSLPGEEPGTELVFGDVSVNSEKKLAIRVESNGRAPVNVIAANLETFSQMGTWTVELNPDIGAITPGRTSTISVTFRPCPQAWNGNVLKTEFDFNTCSGEGQAGDLNITDNTRIGSASIGLSGRAVQPPVATIWCPNNTPDQNGRGMDCGNANPTFRECIGGITFGSVSSNDTPCDLVIEVRNEWRDNKPVGELEVQAIEVLMQDLCCGAPGPIQEGEDIGFTIQDLDGNDLTPDPGMPFVVPITPGGNEGAQRFKFVFSGTRTGLWRGQSSSMTGLRLYTNDPDKRLISVPVSGVGSAPQLACSPSQHNFGPVEQGTTSTVTISCRNAGDAELVIANLAIESGNDEFEVSTDLGSTQNIRLQLFDDVRVFVDYTPINTGADSELLVITSNDPLTPRLEIPLRGGAIPEIEVQPNDALSFPLPPGQDPPFPPQDQPLTISNVGYGDLKVSRLEITGPDDTLTHPSVDDFTIQECAGANPCNIDLCLCAPGTTGCGANFMKELTITYDNNDISTIDLVQLKIYSDDPSDPVHIVVLEAEDEPCLFPTPVATVTNPPACVGQPVMLDASLTNAGPIGATVVSCEWSWLFVAMGAPPTFNTQGLLTNSFVPSEDGLHQLAVHCTNSCGSRSQSPGQESILVSDQCGN